MVGGLWAQKLKRFAQGGGKSGPMRRGASIPAEWVCQTMGLGAQGLFFGRSGQRKVGESK